MADQNFPKRFHLVYMEVRSRNDYGHTNFVSGIKNGMGERLFLALREVSAIMSTAKIQLTTLVS